MNTRKHHLAITLDANRCIGNGICSSIAPETFLLDHGKAKIIQGSRKDNSWIGEVQCDDENFQKILAAGKSCPVNAIRIVDAHDNTELVGVEVKKDDMRVVQAQYDDLKEFVMDPKGYFLIDVDRDSKELLVGFCPGRNRVSVKVVGKKPLEVYQAVIKEGLLSRFDHAAYLGRELQKAYIALQEGLVYVQDDELDFSKKVSLSRADSREK